MGVSDAELCFFDTAANTGQAVTADAISENVIDLHPHYGAAATQGYNIGNGEPLVLEVVCTVAMTDASSNSTCTVTLESDSTANLATSATTHITLPAFGALSAAGTTRIAILPPGQTFERYLGLRFTMANGNLTTGSFKGQIRRDYQVNVNPPSGLNFV